jgi:hypothetical protein
MEESARVCGGYKGRGRNWLNLRLESWELAAHRLLKRLIFGLDPYAQQKAIGQRKENCR